VSLGRLAVFCLLLGFFFRFKQFAVGDFLGCHATEKRWEGRES